MEKYKTPFDLRVDERSFYGGEGGGDKSRVGSGGLARVGRVGVHNGQRLNQFLRDVARAAAAHKSNAAFSKELAKTGDNALKEKIHVCLVYDDGDRGERKRLSVDDGTNFGQVLSRHSPKTAFFSAHRRLSKQERKRERKAGNGAKRASENETQSFGKEQGKKTEGATQESQKVPRPISSAEKSPEKSATSSATYAGKASANLSERTGTGKSSGTSSTGGGGGGGGRNLGPLLSQQKREKRKADSYAKAARDAEKSSPEKSELEKFIASKIRDPVVFPAFRRSVHGAIGDPFVPEDTRPTARAQQQQHVKSRVGATARAR
jgi:hypothetical protein